MCFVLAKSGRKAVRLHPHGHGPSNPTLPGGLPCTLLLVNTVEPAGGGLTRAYLHFAFPPQAGGSLRDVASAARLSGHNVPRFNWDYR